MDALEFIAQFQDHLAPKLDTYEQAIYIYCIRHTRLIGQPEAVIGFKSARQAMAFGIGKAGSPMSEAVCYERLRALEGKGCLTLLGTERGGSRVRVALPHEIPGLIPEPGQPPEATLEELDFFNVPENRARILERESHRCFYCLRGISEDTYVIEHVVSRPDGDNSYRNLVAACRQCNNRKNNAEVEDFLRLLYREALLSANDFADRKAKLKDLREGALEPPAANEMV